jgi:hypothetical protein
MFDTPTTDVEIFVKIVSELCIFSGLTLGNEIMSRQGILVMKTIG